jgi:hypothetical protein
VAHSATILPSTDIQPVMGAVLNAPVLARQFQEPRRVGFVWTQAADDPNCFHFLFAALEFADAVQTRQLRHVREAHLFGRHRHHFDAAPFEAPVAFVNLQELRGKNSPAGSVGLVLKGPVGCL